MARFIVTAAWPYVNYVPHLGTIIHLISADVYARYLKLRGHEVISVSGSDEHGTPIELEARRKGVPPKDLTNAVHARDLELFKALSIELSNYSRTESFFHKSFVKSFMLKLQENGYIFEQEELLPYCERDKIFLPDRFVEGRCPYCGYERARGDQCDNCGKLLHPTELVSPRCSLCGSKPVFKSTRHWYIDLSKISGKLLEWLKSNDELQESVKEYSLNWITQGLKPRSVTRDTEWGIEAPFPGSQGKTIYVWFDALLGYVSATKEYLEREGRGGEFKEWWLNRDVKTVYFIGKDNIPFHSIIFPAMLIASGEPYVLPWRISATEYLLYEGQHFSKSRRIGVWVDEALEIAPGEYWRWVLMRLRPELRDQNFTWSEFYKIVNSELNDDIGNFVNRVLTLIDKLGGELGKPQNLDPIDVNLIEEARKTAYKAVEAMDSIRFRIATEHILELARLGNKYLNERQPWTLAKERREDAEKALWTAAYIIKLLAHLLTPFMPQTAEKLWNMIGGHGRIEEKTWDTELDKPLEKIKISKPEPLFTKLPPDFLDKIETIIEEARIKALKKRPPIIAE